MGLSSWFWAKMYDRQMSIAEEACLRTWRRALLAPLSGDVLEVGAGTGTNVEHYPDAVRRLVLSEPDRYMRRELQRRVDAASRQGFASVPGGMNPSRRATSAAYEVVDAPSERLPFRAESFDAVVSTLVLCSVADLELALVEIRRVLRPNGRFVFLEHVAAEDRPQRLLWQRRIEPFWKRIAGNCHLTRHTEQAIRAAGFEIADIARESMRKAMPLVRPTIRGHACKI
ncbi:MAG: class I SAM-dependent methyltransferase [Myxococcales bacterium]|nr:class I SAM-dependent methyltransferase [Myxococcales bacterium]